MEHTNDFMYPPALTAVGVRVPEDALPALRAFPGPHRVERHVGSTPIRVATAWLDEDVMIGAAGTDGQRPAGRQFHPLTMHWRLPEGGVGWMRMVAGDAVDARADEGQAHVTCAGDAVLEVYAPGATAADVGGGAWSLPGLEVRVEARAEGLAIDAEDDSLFIRYPGASSLTLSVTTR